MWAGRLEAALRFRFCSQGLLDQEATLLGAVVWSLRRQVSPPSERELKGSASGGRASGRLEGGVIQNPAALPPGGRRVTAWLKDGELGKRSFQEVPAPRRG